MSDDQVKKLRDFLKKNPGNAEAWYALGCHFGVCGDVVEAANSFRQVLKLMPDSAEAMANFAMALRAQGDFLQAERYLLQAVELRPGSPDMRYQLAAVHAGMGRYNEAEAEYDQIYRDFPNFTKALTGKAIVLELAGQYERAYELIQGVFAQEADSIETNLLFSRLSVQYDSIELAVQRLTSLLNDQQLTVDEQLQVHAAMGQLLDVNGQYEEAFEHYRKFNEMRHSDFDPQQNDKCVDQIISCYTNYYTGSDFSAEEPQATELIFIIGLPRTGTTLAEQIIASHPEVSSVGENLSIAYALEKHAITSPEAFSNLTEELLDMVRCDYRKRIALISGNAKYVTINERGNEDYLGMIAHLFPDARIVHCSRDPLDSCLSCYFQDFTSGHDYANNLEHLGLHYNSYEKLISFWKRVLDMPFYELVYEELISLPDTGIPALIEFCQLDWHDDCASFYTNRRSVTTPSYKQVRKPLYNSSVQRWKYYQAHLEPLIRVLSRERTAG